jgi:hypothetical protein
VERWTPRAEAAEVLTERLVLRPNALVPALEIDLRAMFERVWR